MSKTYKVFGKNENKKIRRISDVDWRKVDKKSFPYELEEMLDSMMSQSAKLQVNLIKKQNGKI
jgi:hypothetical protein